MTTTGEGPAADEKSDDDELTPQAKAAIEKFSRRADIGDVAFLYRSWMAWSVLPKNKTIAPVTRIIIGDLEGNVLFDRPVVLTGVADLLNELAQTLDREVIRAEGMSDFRLNIPGEATMVLDNLKSAQAHIGNALSLLGKSGVFKDDTASEPSSTED